MKFLAVLAVLAMAFAAFAVLSDSEQNDADGATTIYYVSSSGNDENDGSSAHPFKTLTKALTSPTTNLVINVVDDCSEATVLIPNVDKDITIQSSGSNKVTFTGQIRSSGGYEFTGAFVLKNIKVVATGPTEVVTNKSSTFQNVDFVMKFSSGTAGSHADFTTSLLGLYVAGGSWTVKDCTFAYDSTIEPLISHKAITCYGYADDTSLTVEGSTFKGFARTIQTSGITTLDIQNNTVGSWFSANGNNEFFVQTSTTNKGELTEKTTESITVKNNTLAEIKDGSALRINKRSGDVDLSKLDVDVPVLIQGEVGNVVNVTFSSNVIVPDGVELVIQSPSTLTVASDKTLTNNGVIGVIGTLEFEKTTDNTKLATAVGLQGTGKVIVAPTGSLILNQGKLGSDYRINACTNEITIGAGGKLYAHQSFSTTGTADAKYYSLVGADATTTYDTGEPTTDFRVADNLALPSKAAFALTSGTISIKPTMTSSAVTTVYTIAGTASLGVTESDGSFAYLHAGDVMNIDSGATKFTVNATVPENVTYNVASGATFAGNAGTESLTVTGTVEYADATQVYKNTTITASKGHVNVKGSEGGSSQEETVVINPDTIVDAATVTEETLNNIDADVIVTDAKIAGATVPENKTLVIQDTTNLNNVSKVLDVSKADSAVSIVGTADATFSVKLDTTTTVKVENLAGTVTFTKGSIKIYGDPWTAGTITLEDGDVAKVSGTVGAVTFAYSGTSGSATILVEKDTTLTINTALTIASKFIKMDVEGTVTGAGFIKTNFATDDKIEVNVKDGGVIKTTKIGDDGADTKRITLNVYSGSDINYMGAVTIGASNIKGKDAGSGTWSFNGTKLTLKNYNGTYNFGAAVFNGMNAIDLTGDNYITYAFSEDFVESGEDLVLLGRGSITTITSSTSGSLNVSIDLSNIVKEELFQDDNLVIIKMAAAATNIDGVNVSITVNGENADWTDTQTKVMKVIGISAIGFNTYNADVQMDVMSAYSSDNIFGLYVDTNTVTIDNAKAFDIVSGGTALFSDDGAVTFNNCIDVTLNGKKSGMDTVNDADNDVTIKSTPSVTIKGGMTIDDLVVKESVLDVAGKAIINSIDETNSSSISFTGTAVVGAIDIKQESVMNIKNAELAGELTNGGTVNITGDVMVKTGGSIVNKSVMTNSGVIGVYGAFNNAGTFTNDGTVNVYKYKFVAGAKTFTVGDGTNDYATTVSNLKVYQINTNAVTPKVDGSASLSNVTVNFYTKDGVTGALAEADQKYSGTITPAVNGSYVLSLTNATSTITIIYDASKTGEAAGAFFGKSYSIAVTGNIKIGEDVFYLENNKSEAAVAEIADQLKAGVDNKIQASGAAFVTSKTFNNNGTVIVSSSDVDNIVTGPFNGPLTTNIDAVTISGVMTGDLTANGAGLVTISANFNGNIVSNGTVTVDASKTVKGDITAKGLVTVSGTVKDGDIRTDGGVTSTGTIEGDIYAKGAVTVKNLDGDITVNANGDLNVTVTGNMVGTLNYISSYKATKDAEAKTEYLAKMDIDAEATGIGFIIILAAGSDATDSKAVVPGFFKIGTMDDLTGSKTVELTLTEGKILVDSAVVMKSKYALVIEAGTTIEVNKSAASLDVRNAALKVSKDATSNFETGSATPVEYGKVLSIMSFTISDGAYTIYSNVAYALSNCDEGATLTLDETAAIDQNVVVGAGVTIVVNNVTLTFNGYDVVMADDAKITLEGTGKVIFKQSKDNVAEADADEELEYEFDAVTATIVYGDNTIAFEGVRFTADSTIQGVAETSSTPAKISAELKYNEGIAGLTAGNGTGSLILTNTSHKLVKADAEAYLFSAEFYVAEGTVFDATSITDAFAQVNVVLDGAGPATKIDKYTALATTVTVDGVLNLTAATTTVKGVYEGDGKITLAANKELVLAASGDYEAVGDNINYLPGIAILVVDTTDNENGYDLFASPAKEATLTLKAEKVGTEDVMTIKGNLGIGMVEATNAAYLSQLTVGEEASVTADIVYVVGAGASTANGYVAAKTIYMKDTDADYKELVYETTFESEGYTIYTKFAAIDWDVITDVTIAKDYIIGADLDLSGKDVTIEVAEDATLTVNAVLILGTPTTSLSGLTVISGNVQIMNNMYIIAYADVDFEDAVFIDKDGGSTVKNSTYTIEDVLYATVFANSNNIDICAQAGAKIVPEIEGYNFTKWKLLNENNDDKVGNTNAYAGSKAKLYTIYAFPAEGVTYYLNGVEYAYIGVDQKIEYGKVFTAKINDLIHYQGTPLVNGELSYVVTGDDVLIVTGVELTPAAITYTVTANYAEGVTYYLDGIEFAAGVPQEVAEGSIINAKITDTNNYTGTPLVNGQHSMKITQDVTITVTGVEQKTVTPESEWGITTILLLVLVILIAFMAVVIALRLNRS